MENKKVKNATPTQYANIEFKSKIESMVYRTLVDNGLEPQYEPHKYVLWSGGKPTVPFYTKSKKELLKLDLTKLRDITYTPDFYLEYEGMKVIIEVKGQTNDVFPVKFKMFRQLIESYPDHDKYLIFEIFGKRQLLEAIKVIKSYGSSRENVEIDKQSARE